MHLYGNVWCGSIDNKCDYRQAFADGYAVAQSAESDLPLYDTMFFKTRENGKV